MITDVTPPSVIRGSVIREIDNTSSPVRQFFNERFSGGLKDVQRRFRQPKPPAVAPIPQAEANPGTLSGLPTGSCGSWSALIPARDSRLRAPLA